MKKIKKYVTMALVGVMILSFAGCNLIEKTPEAIQKTVLAKVGDKKITKADVDLALKPYLDQYKQQYGNDFESKEELKDTLKNLRKQQLEGLVDQEVILQNKDTLDSDLSDEEIQTQVDDRVKYFKDGLGSDEKYKQFIESYGYNEDSFQEFLKTQVVVGILVNKMVEDIQVSDEDIQKYYDDNKDKYTKKAGADVTHLLFQPAKDANGNAVEGGDDAAKAKAEAAKAKAAAGTSLKDLSNSDEFKSGDKFTSKFEELGRVSFENSGMVKEFEDAFKKLPANQVSDVVKTEFGYHVIVNTNVYPNDEVTPLDDALKEQIKSTALQEKQQTEYKDKIQELKDKMKIKLYEDKL
ncbi:SurA N-terminal domain-containing protein [Clostridium sp. SHJSY1]|uniref:SurA N-terminal domain-containing protein n=1 Tax=Clostridium sp. SHJSY1 TaxID=2942483 RepID=UPI002876AC50|nr:SurA N-terminal domain-containing protein [Clostridium sp. SHJSY1]MDS0525305.1 SurA N-terminal domain-containing protein [Clostridium sp. SHJSY1]